MFKKWFSFGKNNEEIKNTEEGTTDDIVEEQVAEVSTDLEDIVEEQVEEIPAEPEDIVEGQVEEQVESEDITEQQAEEISEELHDITEGQVQELSEEHDDIVEEHVEEVPVELVDVTEEEAEEEPEKRGFFARLKEGLSKTTQNITGKIDQMLGNYTKIDEDMLEELEEILITSDVGYETTVEIVDRLRQNLKEKLIDNPAQVKPELKLVIESMLQENQESLRIEESPSILVVVGVNGVGKTTSIGKLAHQMKGQGKSVLLAAADTFRAAAADQLTIWAERAGVDIVKHQEGADPSAVIFDGIHAAKKRNIDVLICDTAGRLHNRKNLMQELGKIFKIVEREYLEANKEVLLVIDATTGQNAMNQAKVFQEVAPLSGIILTKLDGTAKGGVVLAITQELKIPVKFIGVGEQIDDLQMFDASSFAEAMIGE
ncbi:signal recognition particle-docking protein FtsY [Filifactor alocis ATCC 35896]|uniref:Signal recognition particle receptor FtsY n=1 Tax=Filifactor alocis (strain ATCC 35896 / CCUG 47790 / D40 B5) TaxID=546269 RepID=D6GTV5_FILAD|nr:signal recognition particle-docking protein FtsY [Filifactor alocis]EFE27626.1 signal recognition particle-docking protein FtsY [Filifactor alocis ATCC 35896]